MKRLANAAQNLLNGLGTITPAGVNFIKKTNIWTILLLIAVCRVGFQLQKYNADVQILKNNIVFDIDKARATFREELNTMYYDGCRYGIDYPEEYRNTVGFNNNSPINYCNEGFNENKEYIEDQIKNFSRR